VRYTYTRTNPAKLFNNNLFDQVLFILCIHLFVRRHKKYLPVGRCALFHLLLIRSERGVLGRKLFHKSSAWKKAKTHLCKKLIFGSIKIARSSKEQKTSDVTVTRCSATRVFVNYILETPFDCNHGNQALLWLSPFIATCM